MKKPSIFILVISMVSITANISHSAQYWAKTYGGYYPAYPFSMQITSDGGYIISGYYDYPGKYLTMKLDRSGNIIWQKHIGGEDIQQTSDGGFILTYNKLISKIDANGNGEWRKRIEVAAFSYSFIQQTTDGGFILSGTVSEYEHIIIKVDENWNISWQKDFGWSVYDSIRFIQQTSDGGYIAMAGFYSPLLLKLDSDGNVSWNKRYNLRDAWRPRHTAPPFMMGY